MKLKTLVFPLAIALALFSCEKRAEENKQMSAMNPNAHKVVVQEVLQANAYTYLRVSENGSEKWIAITKRTVATGETLFFSGGLEMRNFQSKDLDRTFDSVWFVDNVGTKESLGMSGMQMGMGQKPVMQKRDVSMKSSGEGVAISEIYAQKDGYAGKVVKVKGQVVKFNPQIMGKNWAHVQDGSGTNNDFDLTITTNETVKVGDVVTFEGTISLNKDFGAGYSYGVIMEGAKVVSN